MNKICTLQAKLCLLAWLLFGNGADALYRRVRRLLRERVGWLFGTLGRAADEAELSRLRRDTAEIVAAAIERAETEAAEHSDEAPRGGWVEVSAGGGMDLQGQLHAVSKFMLSAEGARMLADTGRSRSDYYEITMRLL